MLYFPEAPFEPEINRVAALRLKSQLPFAAEVDTKKKKKTEGRDTPEEKNTHRTQTHCSWRRPLRSLSPSAQF
eukprot:scaffold193_cov255-Pinguiococcus_pyrenoidosus.AAC.31